jgi:hypothetical protein
MGFFKNVGSKLKRVISIKNALNTVTGNFSAVGKDLVRVASTPDPKKPIVIGQKIVNSYPALIAPNTVIPKPIQDLLVTQGAKQQSKIADVLANDTTFQGVTDVLTKAGIQAFWIKNKVWFIGAGVVIISIFTIHHFTKSSHVKGNVRKR